MFHVVTQAIRNGRASEIEEIILMQRLRIDPVQRQQISVAKIDDRIVADLGCPRLDGGERRNR